VWFWRYQNRPGFGVHSVGQTEFKIMTHRVAFGSQRPDMPGFKSLLDGFRCYRFVGQFHGVIEKVRISARGNPRDLLSLNVRSLFYFHIVHLCPTQAPQARNLRVMVAPISDRRKRLKRSAAYALAKPSMYSA
jgi:hypothetical protein